MYTKIFNTKTLKTDKEKEQQWYCMYRYALTDVAQELFSFFLRQLVNSFNCRNRIPVFAAWAKNPATHKVPFSSRRYKRGDKLKACNTWDGGGVYKHTFPPKASGLLFNNGTGKHVWLNVLLHWHKGFNQFGVRKDQLQTDFEQASKRRISG